MALINQNTWTQANQYVDNYFNTGHVNGAGKSGAKPAVETPERLIAYFQDMFQQVSQMRGGDTSSTHISTGTGGVLVALLARYPDRAKAQEMAAQILNQGTLTLSTGANIALGVDTSPCSNAALADFVSGRGVFAGRA